MEIKYQTGLEHQQRAVDAIVNVFKDVEIEKPSQLYENPKINLSDSRLYENIKAVQTDSQYNVPKENRNQTKNEDCLNLDIKMETGTGKTYVYAHTMFELHKRFGINKFIVAVPSISIKEGAKAFLRDSDAKRHFSNTCGYNTEIDLCVINKSDNKSTKFFPSEVRNFVNGSLQITNRIYVLLVNSQLFTNAKILKRDDYDFGVYGFHRPLDAIKITRPFLIIDEPHHFSRDLKKKTYNVITESIKPQCIIRFGATYPDITEGKRKNKVVRKDYLNLLYNLNSCTAFNQNLIKGVAKEHFDSPDTNKELIKLTAIESKKSATFNYIKESQIRTYILHKGDCLASISPEMANLTIEQIGSDFVELSNGQTKHKNDTLYVSIFSQSYQEAMMKLAIERHFQTERKNFNRTQRIKTLALFFIDDIQGFRGDNNGKNAWLRDSFNTLLKEKIKNELNKENNPEYADFLKASLENLKECSAGYFSRDNSDSDEAIAKEVDDILRNKKGLLSFKNANGQWNVRRFLFSKWTLKDGWDNPNVFTITKLRSSGSENSKIQEVGRGLRLPVDEFGNRISNEEFKLNYIVDFRENDFANRLVAEINGDTIESSIVLKITEEQLEKVAIKREVKKEKLFAELLLKDYLDTDKNVIKDNISKFYDEYPEFNGVQTNKIVDVNKANNNEKKIRIRPQRYAELKELWQKLNRKYVIFFEKTLNDKIEKDFHLPPNAFSYIVISSQRESISTTENTADVTKEIGVQHRLRGKQLPYNDFLKRINIATSLPIKLIHEKITEYFKNFGYDADLINESSVTNFINQFNNWKVANIFGLVKYKQANYNTNETAFTNYDGSLKDDVAQNLLGNELAINVTPSDKYLYDKIVYESELEKKNIMSEIDDVVVYGKIPQRSIDIPTVIGNYSPDFMYVVHRNNGKKELNIVIETKGVDIEENLRGEETIKIKCAQEFFKQLQEDGFDVEFRTQINNDDMKKIVAELIK